MNEIKTSIPIIKIIRPKKLGRTNAENHLQEAIQRFRLKDGFTPLRGYALVAFHENGTHSVARHVTDLKAQSIDFADMVRARVQEAIDIDEGRK